MNRATPAPDAAPRPDASAVFSRVFVVLVVAGAVGVAMLAVLDASRPLRADVSLVARVCGLEGGYAVTVLVLLMSRAPFLERGIGADRLARWHGMLGRVAITAIVIHAVGATAAWAIVRGISFGASAGEVLIMPGLVEATVATLLLLGVGAVSARAARRRLRYEVWHALHLTTYLAIALSFSHELAGPDLAGRPAAQMAWGCLYTLSFALLLRYRLLAPLLQLWRHRMRVVSIVPESKGVVSIIVRGRHLDELRAESGQFFRWRFLTRGTWFAAHPFSLSAPPSQDFLRLTVKSVGDGTALVHQLRPGVRVFAEGPYGAMTERRRRRAGILLIAGGVGITPMRSLFETVQRGDGPLTLLYRASTAEELVFRDELEAIAAERDAELIYLVGSSSEPGNAMTPDNLTRLVPDLIERDVYMCASPRFAAAAQDALLAAGLPRRRLHQEEFAF